LDAEYLPKAIHVPIDFEDRALLEETLTERAGHKVEIFTRSAAASGPSWTWWKTTPSTLSSSGSAC